MNAADLEKIMSIKAGFFSALPAIRALCERALLENEDEEAAPYLLSGIAAADGLLSIARLLHDGDEGWFRCSSCGWDYGFTLFGERVAVYAEDPKPIIAPIAEHDILDARIAALLSIAERAARRDLALRVRHFAGSFVCCKCGAQGPMQPP